MLPRICQSRSSETGLFSLLQKPFIHIDVSSSLPIWSKSSIRKKYNKAIHCTGFISSNIKSVASTSTTPPTTTTSEATEKSFISVQAVVIVKPTVRGFLSNLGIQRGLDDIKDLLGKTLLLELVSSELDSGKSSFN